MDWKALIKTVAPGLATALGGPLAGLAAKAVADALGAPESTEEALEQAAARATPEQLLALKNAERDFALQLERLGVDLEKLAAGDRASAREREAKTGDSLTPRALALLVTLGFFGVLAWLLIAGKPPVGGDALLVMLGSLGTAWTAIIAYYFGSTAGSARKTELIAGR